MIPIFQRLIELLKRLVKRLFTEHVALNVNSTKFEKKCLLLYMAHPFFRVHGPFTNGNPFHQNRTQVVLLARELGAYGFNVDVVDYDYPHARLATSYDLLVDLHPGLNPLAARCTSPNSRRVFYATGSDHQFANAAEAERLKALSKRRNVVLTSRRQVRAIDANLLRSYDAMWFIGNQYNLETYRDSKCRSVSFIRNTGYPFLPIDNPDHSSRAAKRFVFLGGVGQVHKGLDLLLEVFARNRDLTLYVCSKFKWELDFCRCYHEELFDTPNIVPVGFIDILTDRRFADLRKECGFTILPSCSEGQSGSVLAAMSAGLVPIVSKECGFDADEVNHLDDCSIETIERTVRANATCDPTWLREQRVKAMHIAQTRYSPADYVRTVRAAIEHLLNSQHDPACAA